jgi:RNA polymerase sigma-70 factor (ECF subfamily)
MIQPNPTAFDAGTPPPPGTDRPARTPRARRSLRPTPTPAPSPATPVDPSDREELIALVRRAEGGEPGAQAELVQRYTRRVAGFVRSIIRQPDGVEDVTQLVFIKMFRRLSRLRDPAVFESWLFTLARNAGLDFLRRRSCRPATVALDDQVREIPDPREQDATNEILAALHHAVARLSPLDRRLVLQFVAGESYATIAARAGLSLASVKVRLHRVRPYLRASVGGMTDTRLPGSRGWRAATTRLAA